MASHIVPIMDQVPPAVSVPLEEAGPAASQAHGNLASTVPTHPPELVRGTSVRLSVPLDNKQTVTATRKILRRDSLDRREALLKGKEGSRQRRRWENGEFLRSYLHHHISG